MEDANVTGSTPSPLGHSAPLPEFVEKCNALRGAIKQIGEAILRLKESPTLKDGDFPANADHAEMMANTRLAYRHLEDARMRIGKIIQAYDGGTSVYDKG